MYTKRGKHHSSPKWKGRACLYENGKRMGSMHRLPKVKLGDNKRPLAHSIHGSIAWLTFRKKMILLFRWVLRLKSNLDCSGRSRENHFHLSYVPFAFKKMSFGLCNTPEIIKECMLPIFFAIVEDSIEVFIDDFSIVGDTFETCLAHLGQVLQRCVETDFVLNSKNATSWLGNV